MGHGEANIYIYYIILYYIYYIIYIYILYILYIYEIHVLMGFILITNREILGNIYILRLMLLG